jgi:hypothetical protein
MGMWLRWETKNLYSFFAWNSLRKRSLESSRRKDRRCIHVLLSKCHRLSRPSLHYQDLLLQLLVLHSCSTFPRFPMIQSSQRPHHTTLHFADFPLHSRDVVATWLSTVSRILTHKLKYSPLLVNKMKSELSLLQELDDSQLRALLTYFQRNVTACRLMKWTLH